MTHFTLRRGRLFPLESLERERSGVAPAEATCSLIPLFSPEAARHDELGFFGLCLESSRDDPRVELARLALISEETNRPWAVAAAWPPR
jgi:hypothetical protein